MADFIRDDLIQKLQDLARRQKRSVDELIESLLEPYEKPVSLLPSSAQLAREARLRTYERARRYWRQAGDSVRAALTDTELDEVFWLFDHEGIPRLTSEQGTIELPPDPLAIMAQAAREANLVFTNNNVAENADDILKAEFAAHLLNRMDHD